MLKYEIEGGSLPVVICYPEAIQPYLKLDTDSSNKGFTIKLGD